MAKSKPKLELFFYVNIVILIALVVIYFHMSNVDNYSLGSYTMDNIEGVTNMNCCGGIQSGIHYTETDTKPPPYVKRCFKKDDWSGFPCTTTGSNKCCNGEGECVASSKGGYCKMDKGGNKIYGYDGSLKTYLKYSNDIPVDVNDVNDMEDYFFDRSEHSKRRGMSREMRMFMNRRGKNEELIERNLRDKVKATSASRIQAQEKMEDQQENLQIMYWITLIHLFLLIVIAIIIKEAIISKIQGFLDILYGQYVKFSGKDLKSSNVVETSVKTTQEIVNK